MEDELLNLQPHILEDIINGRCILFLGPELLISKDGKYYKSYFKEIESEKRQVYKYFSKDNLFSISGNTQALARRVLIGKLQEFYANAGDEIVLDLISRIPFSLIINIAPDVSINKLFERNGYPFQPAYFPDPNSSGIGTPSRNNPVLYNIFGRIDDNQSLIVTHDDLFKSIKALMQNGSIPMNIRKCLKSAGSFIFLGMKFETWYYQLLLSILEIEESSSLRIGAPNEVDNDTVSVMNSYFQISFAKNNPLKVVQELYDNLAARPGCLRTPIVEAPPTVAYISYAWNDEADANREAFVNLVYDKLVNEFGVKIIRDKNTLTIGDSIESFMSRIGRGKVVIIVVSDKYLRSEYCMYEAWQVYKNDNFNERVFIAALPDINRSEDYYTRYWKEKKDNLEVAITSKIKTDTLAVNQLMAKYKSWSYIHLFMEDFLRIITDTIHYQVPPSPPGVAPPEPAGPAAPEAAAPGADAEFANFVNLIVRKLNDL